MRRILLLLVLIGVLTGEHAAGADAPWPNKPIRLIVPGGPGGVADIRGR